MKKTIDKYYCDDCGKEIDITCTSNLYNCCALYTFYIDYFGTDKDLCVVCVSKRLSHSFSIIKDGSCDACNGKGERQEGYNYPVLVCDSCHGTGRKSL
jgi:hypothetical protein